VTLSQSIALSVEHPGFTALPGQVFLDEPSFDSYEAEHPFAISNDPSTASHPQISLLNPSNADLNTPIFIEETSIDIYKAGQSFSMPPDQVAHWNVNVTLALRSAAVIPPSILLFAFPELNLTSGPFLIPQIPLSTESSVWINATWTVPDSIPQRWYPHNLGTPKLYDLVTTLHLPLPGGSIPLFNFTTRTGFRTIELVQTPYSQEDAQQRGITPGDQWHFEINGKAFYSKGTNVIPFDPFYARVSTEKVRWILESAVKSGQNMVRASNYPIFHLSKFFLGPCMGWRRVSAIRVISRRWRIRFLLHL
jgi:beta-mannosidase